jgi:hypothetical protein
VTRTRYAEGTTVAVEASQAELVRILRKHGVERQAWAHGPEGAALQFEAAGRRYQMRIERPDPNQYPEHRGGNQAGRSQWTMREREWMRRWRAIVLLLKAKLEFADGETTTLERELLPYLLLPGERNLAEFMEDGGYEEVERGGMPAFPMLLGPGR